MEYKDLRKIEYGKIDNLLNEALYEKGLGDDSKWLEYVALREAIKVTYPKPQVEGE